MREGPGTPAAWHEVHPGLWVGDGRYPPGKDFDLVVTLDADVATEHPPTAGQHVIVPLRDTRWEPAAG